MATVEALMTAEEFGRAARLWLSRGTRCKAR